MWKREWGATLFCSHGAHNTRGVAILIRNNFDCIVKKSIVDSNVRFVMLKVLLSGEPALLVNVYSANRDNELVTFFRSLLQTIGKNNLDKIENIIIGGDFNCPLNPVIDKRGGNMIPRQSVNNIIEQLQSELDLHDRRIKNPTVRSFTWSQSNPLICSRLDYWLISNSLSDNVYNVDIILAIKTDHSAITIEFQDVDDKVKGPGLWKLNCLLPSWLQGIRLFRLRLVSPTEVRLRFLRFAYRKSSKYDHVSFHRKHEYLIFRSVFSEISGRKT